MKIFQSDPISQFPLHVQESPSLELDILATSRVYLKIGLHPSSSLCQSLKNVPPYIVWGLIRYSFSAKADNKYTSPLIVPRFQLSTKRSHGPWRPNSLSNISSAIILLQKLFSLKILRVTYLNIQMLWIRARLEVRSINWKTKQNQETWTTIYYLSFQEKGQIP